jgi:hypothetical protein
LVSNETPGSVGTERLAEWAERERRRRHDMLFYVMLRPLLFVFWALVLWGTVELLWLPFLLLGSGFDGLRTTVNVAVESPPWGWVNLLLPVVALSTWLLIGVAIHHRRPS